MRKLRVLVVGGHGPFVPTLAAAALVQKLATGALTTRGATPCVGLLSLDDFSAVASGLSITTTITE